MRFKSYSIRSLTRLLAVAAGLSAVATTGAVEPGKSKARVLGEYVEARTCDVWTGPCFANAEINLRGDLAVAGWAIEKGSWKGVRLDGLKVAVSLRAQGTFGTDAEGKVRAVVYIDERSNARQGDALVALAKQLAPKYLKNIVKVERRKIRYARKADRAELEVARPRGKSGAEVKIETMALNSHCDKICGNEEKAYSSLSKFTRTQCAKTVTHFYRGGHLGARWSDPGARSAMYGSFRL